MKLFFMVSEPEVFLKSKMAVTISVVFVSYLLLEEEAEAEAILPENKLCPCPVCKKGDIYETDTSYVCSERVKGEKCKGRLSKEMCKYVIPRDQALKFFTEGKSDLIEHFISKKGRPFKAHLTCNPLGKRILNWEFPPREPAKKRAATKKSSS